MMEDARRGIFSVLNRECGALRDAFTGECTPVTVNVNSSVQERGNQGKVAMIVMNNT